MVLLSAEAFAAMGVEHQDKDKLLVVNVGEHVLDKGGDQSQQLFQAMSTQLLLHRTTFLGPVR
jgi:hypothetical protein